MQNQKNLRILLALTSLLTMAVTNAAANDHCGAAASGTFTAIDIPGATFVSATGINPRGDIVGRYVARRDPRFSAERGHVHDD